MGRGKHDFLVSLLDESISLPITNSLLEAILPNTPHSNTPKTINDLVDETQLLAAKVTKEGNTLIYHPDKTTNAYR